MTDKEIESLGHNSAFISFLDYVNDLREQEIKAIRMADSQEIMKIAGRLDAIDEILSRFDYRALKERHERLK